MLRAAWVVAAAVLLGGGCLGSQLTPCGDQFCPAGKVCHAPSGSCYGSEQLEACNGLADATECRIADLVGFCRDGICLAPRCGDGILYEAGNEQCDLGTDNSNDANAMCRQDCLPARCGDGVVDDSRGEVCDDGNALPGDDCAPGCGSDETCGNGVQDAGEECDDGNSVTHDGCSGCFNELLIVQPTRSSGPRPRESGAFAFDVARQRAVVFGGKAPTAGLRNDTWEWDGVRWREIKPLTSPSARSGTSLVYNTARKRITMFGGDDGTLKNDLWEYDGARWVERVATTRPPARTTHAFAYDSARRRLVVFGGRGIAGRLNDTWEWDGSTWVAVDTSALAPPPMDEASMAYDPVRNEIVLFGGQTDTNVFSQRTWMYRATGWVEAMSTATLPAARSSHRTVFDASRGKVAIVQGRGQTLPRDVWEFDGSAWQQTTVNVLGVYTYGMATYDTVRRQLIWIYYSGTYLRGTGATFLSAPPPQVPPARMQASAAYDARRGRFVVFGGEGTTGAVPNDTWEWDGSRWVMVSPSTATNPGPRRQSATVFDPDRGIVTAGSDRDVTILGDLWAWNGTVWSQLEGPSTMLDYRRAHGMAYHASRGSLLVYGGIFGQSNTLEWKGAPPWTELLATGPIGYRHNFSMAYDPLRDRTIAVGGGGSVENFLTFEFDGTAWNTVASPPVYGKGSVMVFDPYRKKMVWMVDPEDIGLELWEWAGTTWTKRKPEPTPGQLYRPSAIYDPIRREIVLFGGRSSGTPTSTTTLISYQPNAAAEACTSAAVDYDGDGMMGCDDPDCAARCTPLCVGSATCPPLAPRCGDGVCDPLEDCLLCADCASSCTSGECGDGRCAASEDATMCPGDCS